MGPAVVSVRENSGMHVHDICMNLHVGKYPWLRTSNFSRKMPVSCLNVYMSVPLINVEINVRFCKPCCNCHICRDFTSIFILGGDHSRSD